MEQGGFFYQAFIFLTAAVISVPIAKKLNLGSVLGYLIAGALIGPFVFGFIGQEGESLLHFAEFGVVMMLFLIGLELQPSMIWKLRGPILGMGGSQVCLTALITFGVGFAFDLSWKMSLAVGIILAMSSTAIVLQTLNEKGLLNTKGGQNAFSILLFQDIAVIPILALLPLLADASQVASNVAHHTSEEGHHGTTWVEHLPAWGQTLVMLGAVVGLVVLGRYAVNPCFRWIAKTGLRELFTAASLLLVIGIAILMTQVGLSPALGTFLAGVILAQSEFRHELETDIEPFKGLLLGLFFIAVGASIDFSLIGSKPLFILLLVVLLVAIKFTVLVVIGKVFKVNTSNNVLTAFSLAQGGEFAFVLLSFALQNRVISQEVSDPLVAAVALSMAFTPLLMLLNERIIQPKLNNGNTEEREADEMEESNPVIVAGFGRFGNIVGRFLQANGVSATFLDLDSDNVERVRKIGLKAFYGDASRQDLLRAAGAEHAKIMIVAVDNTEKTDAIIATASKHFPHLKLLVRAHGWRDALVLVDQGVEHVYQEVTDTALHLGVEALEMLGKRRFHAHRSMKKFRKGQKAIILELSKVYKQDEKQFLKHAKHHLKTLEEHVLEENRRMHGRQEEGWDTSLIKQDANK
jgi:monovalent cation:proton antiporter-2 (CPA2) family protein